MRFPPIPNLLAHLPLSQIISATRGAFHHTRAKPNTPIRNTTTTTTTTMEDAKDDNANVVASAEDENLDHYPGESVKVIAQTA